MTDVAGEDIFYKGADGLRLYARHYAGGGSEHYPVLCLPGLTRNSKDFHKLAQHLAPKRRVIAVDFRGRGRSEYPDDAATLNPLAEVEDTICLLDKLGLEKVAIIGTSRGGIVAMLMAQLHPERLAAVVLNDIGPKVEMEGLRRIAGYAGTMTVPDTWDALATALKEANSPAFEMPDSEWMEFARMTFADDNGKPKMDYDPRIGDGIRAALNPPEGEEAAGIPEMWEQFAALKSIPVLAIRGANSDLLSQDTIRQMRIVHTSLDAVTVAKRGHAPLLTEPEALSAIDTFLDRIDRAR